MAPFLNTVHSSASSAISCMRWEMNRSARPSSRKRFKTTNTLATSAAVKAEVASSRMRTRGLRASALAISTICRRDSGRSLTSAIGWISGAPARSSASSARRRCARRSIIPKRRGGLEIAMLSATERSGTSDSSWKMHTIPARLAAAGESKATSARVEDNAPGVRRNHAGENLDQRRFAGAVLTKNCVNAPRVDDKIGVSERANAAVALGYALHAQNRRGCRLQSRHAAKPRRWRNPEENKSGLVGRLRKHNSPQAPALVDQATCFPSTAP